MENETIQACADTICQHISEEAKARDAYMENVWYLLKNIDPVGIPDHLQDHFESVKADTKQYLESASD